MYKVPEEYFFRLHHVRPRFKNDVENVLLYIANKILSIGECDTDSFNKKLDENIQLFPGNQVKAIKTIKNWRTEISSLFSFFIRTLDGKTIKPSLMAQRLATSEDLVEFFKYFLYYFQYPGGHMKKHKVKDVISAGVKFKPAKRMINILLEGERVTDKRFFLTKAEATHFIYNDLRVTRDNEPVEATVKRILTEREKGTKLDWAGDVIRYAGDILDYMVLADLLVTYDNSKYYLNKKAKVAIDVFAKSSNWFKDYDKYYGQKDLKYPHLTAIRYSWSYYVNQELEEGLFKTNLIDYLDVDNSVYQRNLYAAISSFDSDNFRNTKEIGDFGEGLVIGHESMRVKNGGRSDLMHLIKKIPTALAVGYDIQSVELDGKKRFIEVKTTVSSKPLNFKRIHLTPNEWSTAETLRSNYYVYRLMVSKRQAKLFLLQDPVGKYKNDLLTITPRNGVDITFTEKSGEWNSLLIWKD